MRDRRLRPPNPDNVRPWCLIVQAEPSLIAVTEHGEVVERFTASEMVAELARLDRDYVLIGAHLRNLMRRTGARSWSLRTRHRKILDARHDDGFRVVRLPDFTPEGIEAVDVVGGYLRDLATFGVGLTRRGTWTTLGRHLWRATLERALPHPKSPVGRQGFYGARKRARPCSVRHAVVYDLVSAYPSVSAATPIPLSLRETSMRAGKLPNNVEGIACVSLYVPHRFELWPPLPARLHPQLSRFLSWPTGEVTGWYPLNELRMAVDHGAEIDRIHTAYVGRAHVDLFGPWLDVVTRMRREPYGLFAKAHANAVWSSFATLPSETIYRRYEADDAHRSSIVSRSQTGDFAEPSAFVSSLIAARVRERLWREALTVEGLEREDVIHVDTDGIIAAPNRCPSPNGGKPGGWRAKARMSECEIRGPGSYRFRCRDCGQTHAEWHYVAAGAWNDQSARARFEHAARTRETDS